MIKIGKFEYNENLKYYRCSATFNSDAVTFDFDNDYQQMCCRATSMIEATRILIEDIMINEHNYWCLFEDLVSIKIEIDTSWKQRGFSNQFEYFAWIDDLLSD